MYIYYYYVIYQHYNAWAPDRGAYQSIIIR